MRLLLEKDDGVQVEVSKINSIDENCETLLFFLNTRLRTEDIKLITNELESLTGKKCIVLDILFKEEVVSM